MNQSIVNEWNRLRSELNELRRSITIDLITDTPNKFIDLFNEITKDLQVIELNIKHTNGGEFIHYHLDKNGYKHVMFYRDDGNGHFHFDNENYWMALEKLWSNEYFDKQCLVFTKVLVDNMFSIDSNPLRHSFMRGFIGVYDKHQK